MYPTLRPGIGKKRYAQNLICIQGWFLYMTVKTQKLFQQSWSDTIRRVWKINSWEKRLHSVLEEFPCQTPLCKSRLMAAVRADMAAPSLACLSGETEGGLSANQRLGLPLRTNERQGQTLSPGDAGQWWLGRSLGPSPSLSPLNSTNNPAHGSDFAKTVQNFTGAIAGNSEGNQTEDRLESSKTIIASLADLGIRAVYDQSNPR